MNTQCFSTDYVSCNSGVSNNAVAWLHDCLHPCLFVLNMHFNTWTVHTCIPTQANGRNIPDYQIFADKCDEDTWGMEERQEGAEERRELTGTSFQYHRVGHCQKKGKRKGNRKTAKWRLGGQHKHWYHKGEVFLCVMDKVPAKPKKLKADHHSLTKLSYRCWLRGCKDGWLGMIQTILFMGKLTWCLHEHEWWGFNEPINNITTVMRTDVKESKV